MLLLGLVDVYQRHGVARVLATLQELGILLDVLAMRKDRDFLLDLAVASGQHNALPFANWAAEVPPFLS